MMWSIIDADEDEENELLPATREDSGRQQVVETNETPCTASGGAGRGTSPTPKWRRSRP